MLVLAFLCGCLAAAANAATNVMQRSANREISDRLQFSFALVKSLLRRPLTGAAAREEAPGESRDSERTRS